MQNKEQLNFLNMNENLKKALNLASELYGDSKKLSDISFVEHTLDTASILYENKITDENILVAAILHEALDIQDSHHELINSHFGEDIAALLKNYKRLKNTRISLDTPKDQNEAYLIQIFMNMATDLRVLLLRIADKASNSKYLYILEPEKRESSAKRLLRLYSPLSRMVGLGSIAKIMENNAFKILAPAEYMQIDKLLANLEPKIKNYMEETIPVIKELLESEGIKAETQYRIKHHYGIYKKYNYLLEKKRDPGKNFEGILDQVGMRIIVNTVEDCYKTEDIIKKLWQTIESERDDYILNPRPSGYRSLHNIVKTKKGFPIEIQIRTHEMHEFNEYGPASHTIYKLSDKNAQNTKTVERIKGLIRENPFWLKNLVYIENSQDSLESKKVDYFAANIYCFTPKGDIIELPKNATVLDFAYAIHDDIGNRCTGATINGAIAKLSDTLSNGDTVDIKTQKANKKPSKDWIKFVVTKKARHSINKFLKN